MGLTLTAWLQALQALLPPGQALTREPGAVLTRLLEAAAATLLAAQLRLVQLVAEFDPRVARQMLPDWERLLGLPDLCADPAAQELGDRQQAAFGRLTEIGGQSRAYFIDLAERNGEPGVTITEFRPFNVNGTCNAQLLSDGDAFCWRVTIPRTAAALRRMTCNSTAGSALQMYTPSTIECLFRARKPAHTTVFFGYHAA